LESKNYGLSHSNTSLKEENTKLRVELTGLQKKYQQVMDFLKIKELMLELEKYLEGLKQAVVKKSPLGKKKSRGMDR
ncbi:MAG: hypothetical protein R3Y63_09065, partial [Eubacteriales bacterium]